MKITELIKFLWNGVDIPITTKIIAIIKQLLIIEFLFFFFMLFLLLEINMSLCHIKFAFQIFV